MAFRILAGLFLIAAAFALAFDATRAGPGGTWLFMTLGQHWAALAPALLTAAQGAVQRLHPMVWDLGIKSLLAIPAWMFFAVLGVVFGYLGRRRRRVNIFAN